MDDTITDDLEIIELEASLADAEKPEELKPGRYTGEIVDVQVKTSQAGNRYFATQFKIPPDEIAADQKDAFEDGCNLYWNRQIVPKKGDRRAMWNLKKFYEALGLELSDQINPNDWMGQRAKLVIVMGKNQDKEDRAEIKSIEPAEAKAAPAKSGRKR